MLSRLGLMLIRAMKIRNQRYMNKQTVLTSYLKGHLPHRLQKRLRLDIAYGSADFGNNHIRVRLLPDAVDKLLDFICYMRNNLNGRS